MKSDKMLFFLNGLMAVGVIAMTTLWAQNLAEQGEVKRALECHAQGMSSLRECFQLQEVEDWLPEQNDDLPEKCPSARQAYGPGLPEDMIECVCYDVSMPPNISSLYDWGMMCD